MVQSIGSPIAWNFGQEKQRTRAAKCRDYAERKRGKIVYKHFPAKILRRKRNEKLRQKIYICDKPFVFVLHQTSSCCTGNKRWPAKCCLKTQGKQWHLGSSTSSNFPGAVLHCQFNNIWKKKSISLFFLSLFFLLNFFWQFRPEKNHNQKVPKTNSWLIKGD